MDQHREVCSGAKMRISEKKNEGERKSRVRRMAMEDEREDINKLADNFIKSFRNQLKIQREESFKRFREMIARGT
ncbi:hypothetical protein Acr_28g0014790 [Actinidia rufa]|uniref:Uncharacterized protein n=1 Tax=Actinidia rufa TaxID=165716 RepID=A0A7J0HDI2_9ERIC|nr:hypothetical protein Acr_28g0014790 [Actinidia rufa]